MVGGIPLDATRNSLVLPTLGLPVEQPAHAYEVTARLASRYPQPEILWPSATAGPAGVTMGSRYEPNGDPHLVRPRQEGVRDVITNAFVSNTFVVASAA
jgi:hypothetical protein